MMWVRRGVLRRSSAIRFISRESSLFFMVVLAAMIFVSIASFFVHHRLDTPKSVDIPRSQAAVDPQAVEAGFRKSTKRKGGRRCASFFFDPIKSVTERRDLRVLYNFRTFAPEPGKELIDMFDPVRRPHRHLIPVQDDEAIRLSQYYDRMGDDLTTVVNHTMMLILTNKKRFARFLRDKGFGDFVPDEYMNPDMVRSYPVVFKLTKSTASQGTFLANNRTELNTLIEGFGDAKQEYILQEFIPNQAERAVHISAVHGKMIRMICHERLLEEPIYFLNRQWRSITPPALDNADCHEELYREMVKAINFTGIGNFDVRLKELADGTIIPKVIEMNPRVSGTVVRNATLLADMVCSIQWNGEGIATPNGCLLNSSEH